MALTGIDQLWVADITYIRLQVEFVYLAVLLDAFSRRCLGWALRRSLEAALALEALRMALTQRDFGMVVGGSGCRRHYGPDYCQRGTRRHERQNMLRLLLVFTRRGPCLLQRPQSGGTGF